MKIRPLHDRVMVKREEEERKSPGGIDDGFANEPPGPSTACMASTTCGSGGVVAA
jgi:hypothetical protein